MLPCLAVPFVLSAASSPCPDLNLIHYKYGFELVGKQQKKKTPPIFLGGVGKRNYLRRPAGNQRAIRIGLGTAQVGQQAAALADHFQQAATAVVVFGVGFEVGVRSLMRKVNRATCTSEELMVAFFALEIFNDLCFCSTVSAIMKTPKYKNPHRDSDKFAKPEDNGKLPMPKIGQRGIMTQFPHFCTIF